MTKDDQALIEVEIVSASPSNAALQRLGSREVEFANNGGSAVVREFGNISPDDLSCGIENVCAAVKKAMERTAPESCDVEFSLGFKAGAKIPVLLSGEANAALKVTLRWKNKS